MIEDIKIKLENFFSNSSNLYVYEKDHVLISSGEEDIVNIFFLKSGFVKQTFCNSEGNEMILNIFKPYSYFPMMLFMSGLKNKYTFSAFTNIKVYKVLSEDIFNYLKDDNNLLLDLTTRYAKGLSGLLLKVEMLMYTDSFQKLIILLIYLSQEFGRKLDDGIVINIYLTHEDLSSWLGIQRETLSKQFEILERRGILEYLDKLIFIRNIGKLYILLD